MKANPTITLSCSVLGHNLMRSKTSSPAHTELICKNCNTVVNIEKNGNFSNTLFSNQDIQNTLWELFLKNRKLSKLQSSARI